MSYYYNNKFIPQAAARLSPLLEKNSRWHWTDECNNVFQECIINKQCSISLLRYQETSETFMHTSQYGMGAVLSHTVNGEERPITFASWTLSRAERN